jgi:hypothetical protein
LMRQRFWPSVGGRGRTLVPAADRHPPRVAGVGRGPEPRGPLGLPVAADVRANQTPLSIFC